MISHKKILKEIRKIEIRTRHLVEGLLQGAYLSVFRGRGIEFSEVREYEVGDDIRAIDWNVTARMNHPYVKEFIEERDLTVYILFDISGSGDFGSEVSKREAATILSSSLMFAALRNNDKVGLGLFTDHVEKFYPAKKGRRHVLRLIKDLAYFRPKSRKTDIAESLAYLAKAIRRRSIIFIISDFISDDDYSKQLRMLKGRHDVIAVNLHDIKELDIPDVGYIELEDDETGEQLLVDTSDPAFREEYAKLADRRMESMKSLFKKLRIDVIDVRTDEKLDKPLRRFFSARTQKATI